MAALQPANKKIGANKIDRIAILLNSRRAPVNS
jgi:hypothetical protein